MGASRAAQACSPMAPEPATSDALLLFGGFSASDFTMLPNPCMSAILTAYALGAILLTGMCHGQQGSGFFMLLRVSPALKSNAHYSG